MRVPSSDQINVAVHDFGGSGRPLLLSHATGFHAHCYLPLADRLSTGFVSHALDYRGHGATPRPDDWRVDWERYGDDARAAAEAIAERAGRPLVGFGHSMGATALLMAAHRNPALFDVIVGFEPIVFPTDVDPSPRGASPMIEAARNRRPTFPSFEAALDNFGSKPPMSAFDADVRRLYVGHGFRPSPEGVRLICEPEHEARTFEQGAQHRTWDLLPDIATPTVIIAGANGMGPAIVAPRIAGQLPHGTFVERADWNHLSPFIDPDGVAELIRAAVSAAVTPDRD
ncbi:MAG: alpha/beta hydrolase [Ilumatobacter sp.]|nr:alpha/beta hydrolase [Ilumatobacter sp.]